MVKSTIVWCFCNARVTGGNFHAKAGNCYENWKTHIGSADGAAAQSVADIELYPYSGAMQYAVSVTIG